MSALFAMTLPALVVVLVVVAAVDALRARRRRRRGDPAARPAVAAAGFDSLGTTLAPGTRHKLEHDEFMELDRDEEGDAAPPRSEVDLDANVARIVVRPASAPREPR
jgi:Family of unknown function (DUF6191)